ncbi:MAG TPA: hypothetical protein VJM08_18830, partial [Anaerolineales bacterium]|nr:hypothetical protein [Anaerolineales bacterium]
MLTLRKLWIISFLLALIVSACGTSTNLVTSTPRPNATEDTSEQNTPTPAASQLNVEEEALRGKQLQVWHPWFGAEASLFESQMAQFNTENEWGIIVSAESMGNYSELFFQTDEALKDASNPQIVIAFPEHALGWQEHVVDLNPYVNDPIYGLDTEEVSDFPQVIWAQDEVDGKRYGVPAQ